MIKVLKCKLKDVIITECEVEYEGSLTLDYALMQAAGLHPFEFVQVNSKHGLGRIDTYVIPAPVGSGTVAMNGGAANHFQVGEHIHVNCFEYVNEEEWDAGRVINIKTDRLNKIQE